MMDHQEWAHFYGDRLANLFEVLLDSDSSERDRRYAMAAASRTLIHYRRSRENMK